MYWLAVRFNAAPQPAAALALATTMLLTGAMHEDGLADTADGLGGKTREQKLDIMRDSRIGTFGACALAISLMLRWSTIADDRRATFRRPSPLVAGAWCGATGAALPTFMRLASGSPPGRAVERRRATADARAQSSPALILGVPILACCSRSA